MQRSGGNKKDVFIRVAELAAAPVTTLVPRWDRDWVKLHKAVVATE